MTRVLLLAASMAAFATLFAPPSEAADRCAARADMIKALDQRFHENPAALGMVNPNVVLEIFVSDKGTWTIIATGTDGKSCVLSAGEGWQSNQLAGLPGA